MALGDGNFTAMCPSHTPLLEFANNVAFGNKRYDSFGFVYSTERLLFCTLEVMYPVFRCLRLIVTGRVGSVAVAVVNPTHRIGLYVSGDYRPRQSPCDVSTPVPANFDSLVAIRNVYAGATFVGATPVSCDGILTSQQCGSLSML